MLTRRQLMLSAAALNAPAAWSLVDAESNAGYRGERIAVLETRWPFIDANDVAGARLRALNEFVLLIKQSRAKLPSRDWLVGAAFALSGGGPFSPAVLRQLALDAQSIELKSLTSVATTEQLRLTFGAWWRDSAQAVSSRLLTLEPSGRLHTQPLAEDMVVDGVRLHLPVRSGISLPAFCDQCRTTKTYGARIEQQPLIMPPPGAPQARLVRSALVNPAGQVEPASLLR